MAYGCDFYRKQTEGNLRSLFIAVIYSVASMNKVSVNQDITKYLPADSETNRGLSLMEEQFLTYGSARL